MGAHIYGKLMMIQQELKAPKGQYNSFAKYNYRSCEDILEAVKPLCIKNNATLPASQVVRTIPRGGTAGSAPQITAANVPKVAASPAAANTITVIGGTINVPQ